MRARGVFLGLGIAVAAWSQPPATQQSAPPQKHTRGPGKEMASGAGAVGVGAAKGAGDLGKGTAKGAVDLATLHPIDGAASVGKGAVAAGKDVGVGAVKGTARITKGVAKGLKKIL